jgi:hypothetical protein
MSIYDTFEKQIVQYLVAKYKMLPEDAQACLFQFGGQLVPCFYENWTSEGPRAVKFVAEEIVEKLEWAGGVYIRTAKNRQ